MARHKFTSSEAKAAGKVGGQNKKGSQHKKSIVLQNWTSLSDAKNELLAFWQKTLHFGSRSEKIIAAKEISKYIFSTKVESTRDPNSHDERVKRIRERMRLEAEAKEREMKAQNATQAEIDAVKSDIMNYCM